jgi:hypothetical protein
VTRLLIRLGLGKDQLLSIAACERYLDLIANTDARLAFVTEAVKLLRGSRSGMLTAHCLVLLIDAFQGGIVAAMPANIHFDMELAVLQILLSDFALCRLLAMHILKSLSAVANSAIFKVMQEQRDALSEAMNRLIRILVVPEHPTQVALPVDSLDFDQVCCSRYSELWLLFLA